MDMGRVGEKARGETSCSLRSDRLQEPVPPGFNCGRNRLGTQHFSFALVVDIEENCREAK